MKKSVRHIYPGGNTPQGFFSYYNYILSQRNARKLYCIKGGPGTGKSTMMKEIGKYFEGKGEAIDFFWCSSDPDSLDGVLLKDRNIELNTENRKDCRRRHRGIDLGNTVNRREDRRGLRGRFLGKQICQNGNHNGQNQ